MHGTIHIKYSYTSGVLSVCPVKFSDDNLNKTTPTACRIRPLFLFHVLFDYVSAVLKMKRFHSPDCTFAADKETITFPYPLALNTLRTGDADLCFYITTVQDG